MSEPSIRTAEFQRNDKLEDLLRDLNDSLGAVEDRASANFTQPRYPIVFLVGCCRCGSTLGMQLLASTGAFSYSTNLLSRFYRAPRIGAIIQRILTHEPFDFRGELSTFRHSLDFSSDLGKTKGPLAPHEFWYFWRRFFPGDELMLLDEANWDPSAGTNFARELAAWEDVENRPLALKGLHLNFHIPYLANLLPRSVFLFFRRDPILQIQSILSARERHAGSISRWWSVKPPEFEELSKHSPEYQVAGQIWHTNRHIEAGLANLPESRKINVFYEDFCAEPEKLYSMIVDKFSQLGHRLDPQYRGPKSFERKSTWSRDRRELSAAQEAYTALSISSVNS
jgi:hypothetical protein